MKKLVFDRYGDPTHVLRVQEAPIPVPADGELLVRMLSRPINPYELALISGGNNDVLVSPQVPGFEGVGIVEATGDLIHQFKKGQRVIPTPVDLPGTWQEYVTGRPEQFISVSDGVSDTQAALVLNPLTCWVILREKLNVREGQWVLNTAASTNIGQLLIQFAGIMKFKLINVVRNRKAEEHIRLLGADHIINTSKDDLVNVVEHLTKGAGVSGIIDPVGGAIGSLASRTLGFGGNMLIFSNMSGDPVSIEPMEFISKKLSVSGYTSLHWLNQHSYEFKTAALYGIFDLISKGLLDLKTDGEYPLEGYSDAIRRSIESGRTGKIMLV